MPALKDMPVWSPDTGIPPPPGWGPPQPQFDVGALPVWSPDTGIPPPPGFQQAAQPGPGPQANAPVFLLDGRVLPGAPSQPPPSQNMGEWASEQMSQIDQRAQLPPTQLGLPPTQAPEQPVARPEPMRIPAADMLTKAFDAMQNLNNGGYVVENVLRTIPPERHGEFMEAAQVAAEQLKKERPGFLMRLLQAPGAGLEKMASSVQEAIGLGGSDQEIALLDNLRGIASGTTALAQETDPWYTRLPVQVGELSTQLGMAGKGIPGTAVAFGLPRGQGLYREAIAGGAGTGEALASGAGGIATETALFSFHPFKFIKTIPSGTVKILGGADKLHNRLLETAANLGISTGKGSALIGSAEALGRLNAEVTKWAGGRGDPDLIAPVVQGFYAAVEAAPLMAFMHGPQAALQIGKKPITGVKQPPAQPGPTLDEIIAKEVPDADVQASRDAERLSALPGKLAAGETASRGDAFAWERMFPDQPKLPTERVARTEELNRRIKEMEDAEAVRSTEAQAGGEQSGEDLRGTGKEQGPAEQAGEVPKAQVAPPTELPPPPAPGTPADFLDDLAGMEFQPAAAPEAPRPELSPPPVPADKLSQLPQPPVRASDLAPTPSPAARVTEQKAPPAAPEQPSAPDPFRARVEATVASVPLWKGATVETDADARTARVSLPDGRSTTVHFDADAEVDQIAQSMGKKGRGAYTYTPGAKGEGSNIWLRKDASPKTVNHEALHWLQDMGIVTPEEVEAHGGLEPMARAYGEWVAGGRKGESGIFARIWEFVQRLLGDQGAQQRKTFKDIEGRVAPAEQTKPAPKPLPDMPPLEGMTKTELNAEAKNWLPTLKNPRILSREVLVKRITEARVKKQAEHIAKYGVPEGTAPKAPMDVFSDILEGKTGEETPPAAEATGPEKGTTPDGLGYTRANYEGKTQFVFKTGKEEVGEIAFTERPDGNLEVSNVLVWPKFQRKGFGTRFYEQAWRDAQAQGKKMFISGDRTEDAKALHEKFSQQGILKPDGEIDFSKSAEPAATEPAPAKPAAPEAAKEQAAQTAAPWTPPKIEGRQAPIGDEERAKLNEERDFLRKLSMQVANERGDLESKLRGTRKNASKQRGKLQGEITEKSIAERRANNRIREIDTRLQLEKVEGKIDQAPDEATWLALSRDREDLLAKMAEKPTRTERYTQADEKVKRQHQANSDRYYMQLKNLVTDAAEPLKSELNKDEIDSIASYIARDYRGGDLQKDIRVAADRQIQARKGSVPDLTAKQKERWETQPKPNAPYREYPHLSEEQRAKGIADLEEAVKHPDWHDRRDKITKRLESENQANAKVVAEERRKQAEIDAEEARVRQEQAESEAKVRTRERADTLNRENRFWKALKEEGKKFKTGKAKSEQWEDRVKVEEQGEQTGTDDKGKPVYEKVRVSKPADILDDTWAIAENWRKSDSEEKQKTARYSLVHRPSGLVATWANTPAQLREVAALMRQEGIDAKDAHTNKDTAKNVGKVVRAYEEKRLDHLGEERQKEILAQHGAKEGETSADVIVDANDFPKPPIATKASLEKLKEFAKAVPEFGYDPVMTVDKNGNLVYRDGYKFTFRPEIFGAEGKGLKPGMTVGFNLEDLDITRKTAADVVADKLEEAGFKVSRGKAGITASRANGAVRVTGEGEQWTVAPDKKARGVNIKQLAENAIDNIRWKQPPVDAPKTEQKPVFSKSGIDWEKVAEESSARGIQDPIMRRMEELNVHREEDIPKAEFQQKLHPYQYGEIIEPVKRAKERDRIRWESKQQGEEGKEVEGMVVKASQTWEEGGYQVVRDGRETTEQIGEEQVILPPVRKGWYESRHDRSRQQMIQVEATTEDVSKKTGVPVKDLKAYAEKGEIPGAPKKGAKPTLSEKAASSEQVAKQIQQEADEGPAEQGMGAGLGGMMKKKIRSQTVAKEIQSDDPAMEERLQKAHGLKRPSMAGKIKEAITTAWHAVTRAQIHLSPRKFPAVNEQFRLFKEIGPYVEHDIISTVAAFVDGIDGDAYQLYERYVVMRNVVDAIHRSPDGKQSTELNLAQLQYTDDPAKAEAYLAKLQALVDASPAVQKALENRKRFMEAFVQELVAYKQLSPEALDHVEAYFHQQVASMMETQRLGGATPRVIKRSFQKRRQQGTFLRSAEHDPNTNYVESEVSWMVDAKIGLETEKWFRKLDELNGNQRNKLSREAKRVNFERLVGGPEVVARIEELRGLVQESRESEDRNESYARQQRAHWLEELDSLDPTRPYRQRMAMARSKLLKAVENGEIDLGNMRSLLTEEDANFLDMDAEEFAESNLMRVMGWVAKEYAGQDASISALTFLKAVSEWEAMIRERLGDEYETWASLVPDGMKLFQPDPGNQFYTGFTIPEKIAERIMQGLLEGMQLDPSMVKAAVIMGGKKRTFVLPEEVVDQLHSMRKPSGAPWMKAIDEVSRGLSGFGKTILLHAPNRILGYMTRNVLGDHETIIAAMPKAEMRVPQSASELKDYFYGTKLEISDNLRAARRYGVIGASQTAQETTDLENVPILSRLYDKEPAGILKLPAWYFDEARRFGNLRESIGRYAVFLQALDDIKAGRLSNYGASVESVVRGILRDLGPEAAAAHIARNLVGDYGNATVFGQWLSQHLMWFYKFQEINMKRWPSLFLNSLKQGRKSTAKTMAAMGLAGVRGTVTAAATVGTLYGAALAMKYGWAIAAAWVWNNLIRPPDEEKDLPLWVRQNSHINLGRNPDGTVRAFVQFSTLGEFVEWFGLNSLLSLWPEVRDGKVSVERLATEMAWDPVNKTVQLIRPEIKQSAELLTGKSTFPDIRNQRPIPKDEIASQFLGATDLYKDVKGLVTGSGERGRPNYMQRWLGLNVSDPRANALSEIHELRGRFLESKGKDRPEGFGVSKIKTMRDAVAYNDRESFRKAKAAYLEAGHTLKQFKASLARIDPLSNRLANKDEIDFEKNYLNDIQRNKLQAARDYARDLEATLQLWWNEESTPEEKKVLRRGYVKALENSDIPQKRKIGESVEEFRLRRKDALERDKKIRSGLRQVQSPQ